MQEELQAILINIPSNTFQYYINDSVAIKSKVITGKPETPTPFNFDSKISHFLSIHIGMQPYTIATKEILPKLKLDSAYLTSANFDMLDRRNNLVDQSTINWKKYSETYFPFRLRQRDGTENTLGVLKFMFSNPYAIYLHDTNSRKIFQQRKSLVKSWVCSFRRKHVNLPKRSAKHQQWNLILIHLTCTWI